MCTTRRTLDGSRQGVSHLCRYGSDCKTSRVKNIFFRHFHASILPMSCFFFALPLILIVLLLKNKFNLFYMYCTNYLGYFVLYLDPLGFSLHLFYKIINEVKMTPNVKFPLQFWSLATSLTKHHVIDLVDNTKDKQ